jgi:glycosyltransferase involved in cell wall biosynthesis
MRILSVSNCLPLPYLGSGYIINNFCKGLERRGHQVDLFGPNDFEILKSMQPKANSYRQTLGMVKFVITQLRHKPYDIVEFYGAQAWLIILILSIQTRRNFLLVSHSNGVETHVAEVMEQNRHLVDWSRKWYQFDQSKLFGYAFTRADGIITVSHYDAAYVIQQQYASSNRLQVIENPLPETFLGLPIVEEREKTIGFCGSWLHRKGTLLIQEAVPDLLKEFPDWKCKLIGVGAKFEKESVFPASVCSQIEIIPFVEDKLKLRTIYESLAILMVPSIYESFGLVTAEAMACGCAIVASPTGFAASLHSGEEALILESLTPSCLYYSLRELMTNESRRTHIARNGYQRVQKLRWDTAVEKLEETYQRWLWEFRCNKT